METITIQLLNDHALKLIKQLEELHLIKLVEKKDSGSQKLSEILRGKLSEKSAEALQKYVSESRNEWNRI
jgi:hypothetical protein